MRLARPWLGLACGGLACPAYAAPSAVGPELGRAEVAGAAHPDDDAPAEDSLDPLEPHGHRDRGESVEVRPYGAAEFGLGLLTLPGAEVCVNPDQGCSRGDTSLEVNAWQLFRVSTNVAFGAGITLALLPTTDAPREDPPGLPREHLRRYFTAEAVARYYPIVVSGFESWLGVTGGLVVISDTFKAQAKSDDRALVGPQGVTIRTEGLTAGFAGGLNWWLSTNWQLGTTLRLAGWFLPNTPKENPLGDEASLSGRVVMVDLGVNVGYRLPF